MSKTEDLAGLLDANGDVLATNLDNVSVAFADLTGKPTTISGYGITDAFDGAYSSLTGAPTVVSSFTNDSGYATTTYVDGEIADLVASAPATLDTLNELAAALGDDANFSTTVTNSIATKAPIDQPQFTYNSGAGEAARITSDGRLLVGKTTTTTADEGVVVNSDGFVGITRSGNNGNPLSVLRRDTDGDVIQLYKDTTQVGSIGANLGKITVGTDDTALFFDSLNDAIGPRHTNGDARDAAIDLGRSSHRFKDLYLSNSANITNTSGSPALRIVGSTTGVCKIELGDADNSSIGKLEYNHTSNYLDFKVNDAVRFRMEGDGDFHADGDVIAYSTTISDARLKDNIQGIENAVAKVGQLNGYTFEYKADGKVSAGVIAQEVEQVLPEAVSEKKLPLKTNDDQEYKVVNYDALHGLLIEAIKELSARVEALEAK